MKKAENRELAEVLISVVATVVKHSLFLVLTRHQQVGWEGGA